MVEGISFKIHFKGGFFMFKKTRVRQIIELLQKDLSNKAISEILNVSRNSVDNSRN